MKEKSLSDMILEILCEDAVGEDKGLTGEQLIERLQVEGYVATDGSRPTKATHLRIIDGGVPCR